jgi:hypothetical protein
VTYRSAAWAAGLCLAIAVCPGLARGQSADQSSLPTSASSLAELARGHEAARRWEDAFQTWMKVLAADRAYPDARERLATCLRNALQVHRHRDPAMLARVMAMSQAEALALYGEVLTKVQAYYVDPEKVTTIRLFRQGLDEYLAALGDPAFLDRHSKGTDKAVVSKFRQNMQTAWANREVLTPRQAVEIVSAISAQSRDTLKLRSIHPVVCEFICGACNSLDEHSSFVSGFAVKPETPGRSVEVRPVEENILFLRITHFHAGTPQEVADAVKPFGMARQARAMVLDLRGNAGGSFTAAVKTAELFLPGGIIVTAQGPHDEVNKVHTSFSGASASHLPMVVLVDGDTASAAEVLAVALRDNGRAKLIGTATFGKGSVQNVVAFSTAEETDPDGKPRPRAAVRITLARLLGPTGAPISGGVTPDHMIADRDRQEELAMEQARQLARDPGMRMSPLPMMRP